MSCREFGLNLSPKMFKLVDDVAEGNRTKARILAMWLEGNDGFNDYIAADEKAKADYKAKGIEGINGNTIKRLLREYYNIKFPTVNGFTSGKAGVERFKFASSSAAIVARDFLADIISDLARENVSGFRSKSDFYVPMRKKVTQYYISMVKDITNSNIFADKKQGYLKRRGELLDIYRDENRSKEERNNASIAIYAMDYDLVRKYGSYTQRQFGQLVKNIRSNAKDFMDFVFSASKLTGVLSKSVFDGTENYEEIINSQEDSLTITNMDADATDTMMRDFSRDNVTRGSFDSITSAEVNFLFNSLVNLESADSGIIDTNNELGVPTRMNYRQVIHTLLNGANFNSSIEEFVESIKDIAYKQKANAGLINLYKQLKNNPLLANQVYIQLNKPKIKKAIVSVSGDNIELNQSNTVVNPEAALYYETYNRLKFTAGNEGILNHISMAHSIIFNIETMERSKSGDSYDMSMISANEKIKDIFAWYFTNIPQEAIDSYLNYGDKIANYRKLANVLIGALNEIKTSVENYEDKVIQYNSLEDKQGVTKPILDASFTGNLLKTLNTIVSEFAPFIDIKNDLNSRNSEGNVGSDVINNSWITSIIGRIKYGNKEDKFAGLRSLGNFYIKSPATYSNPLLFDQFDNNGIQISHGLFRLTGDNTFTVNDYAKDILDVYLYNGIENQDSGKASTYENMSTVDYFMTMLTAFHKPIEQYNQTSIPFKLASYFSRTPSDAPKNFIYSAPKHDIGSLYEVDKESFDNYKKKFYGSRVTFNSDAKIDKTNIVTADKLISYITSNPDEFYIGNKTKIIPNKDGTAVINFTFVNKAGQRVTVSYVGQRIGNKISSPIRQGIQVNSSVMPIEIADKLEGKLLDYSIRTKKVKRFVKHSNPYFKLIYKQLVSEFEAGFKALSVLGTLERRNGKTYVNFNKDIKQFSDRYYTNNGELFDNDGKLTGNAFKFYKLYNVNGFDVNAILSANKDMQFLYGGTEVNPLYVYDSNTGTYKLELNEETAAYLESIVVEWIQNLSDEVNNFVEPYRNIIEEQFNDNQIEDFVFNQALTYMTFDDIFEGNAKYYKDARDLFKRNKEIQAGGQIYSGNKFDKPIGEPITKISQIMLPRKGNAAFQDIIDIKSGFNAVTIENTVRPSKHVAEMRKYLTNIFKGTDIESNVIKRVDNIVNGFADRTKTNDAQSYITLDEFIRRKHLDGTFNKYKELIRDLVDPNVKPEDIDYTNIKDFIQVQKNFYYDLHYDEVDQMIKPRQIKNAEFVLIPKLLPENSSLRELYDIMVENNIDQINTVEADKAAKRGVLTYWDNNGEVTAENKEAFKNALKNKRGVEPFYYNYLYAQQEVPQHISNAKNKLAVQISKKIFDNVNTASPKVKEAFNRFQNAYITKIKRSFDKTIKRLGLEVNPNGSIKTVNGIINVDAIYSRAREEAQRLGVDSNFLEYLNTDEMGSPYMPNWMNNVSVKLESIAQAIFNRGITRQMLPGFHGAQVTNVGYSDDLAYRPAITNEKGEVIQEAYMEVRMPRWNSNIPKDMTADQLPEDLQQQIAYRIPTEGKQSVIIIKIKEFLPDAYGSTIIVPDEWVTQTGSDFDIDSIYGIGFNVAKRAKSGKIFKIPYTTATDEVSVKNRFELYKAYVNSNISLEEFSALSIEEQNTDEALENEMVDALIDIMSDESSVEEQLGRSKYDDLSDAANKINKLIPKTTIIDNPYNVFSQIQNRDKAQSGATLKAFSVNRDTFNSICNVGQAVLNNDAAIVIKYTKSKYDFNVIKAAYDVVIDNGDYWEVKHNKFAHSNNNRNVVGQIITSYSSQTTAHILDAVKVGSLFNENKFTFGTFKTLIDLGTDYYTAELFLAQPGVSRIVEAYNSVESQIATSYSTPINIAIKDLAIEHKLVLDDGSIVTEYTPMPEIIKAIRNKYNIIIPTNNEQYSQYKIILNQDALVNNITNPGDFVNELINILDFEKLYRTTRNIESVMRCCNPDKFGAKQSIKATRDIIDRVNEFRNPISAGNILMVGDKTLIGALYPLNDVGNIDVDKSFYKYIAAFMRYSTQTSVNVNKLVFPLESDYVYTVIKELEKSIHTRFTEEQYRQLQEYAVSYVYNMCETIVNPMITNEDNKFIIDSDTIENAGTTFKDQWDREQLRVRGLLAYENPNVKISNFINPTAEDIAIFAKLSPVQKVDIMQRVFARDSGIFKYIRLNTFNNNEIKSKGYSSQYMFFNDRIGNIENVLSDFNRAAYSKNPLIRLAVLDLVKYSFIVEGFKFKKNSISKLITAKFLKDSIGKKGTNIIAEAQYNFSSVFNISDLISGRNDPTNDSFEKFIRQNPNIIKLVSISKQDTRFNDLFINDIIEVPFNEHGYEFLEYTGYATIRDIDNDDIGSSVDGEAQINTKKVLDIQKYVRIQRTLPNGLKTVTLYKSLYKPDVGLFYIPLNLLDPNEVADVSVNPNNNKFYETVYYETIVNEAARKYTSIKQLLSEDISLIDSDILKEYRIPKFTQSKSRIPITNSNAFMEKLNANDPNSFIGKMIRELGQESNIGESKIIATNNKVVANMLPNVNDSTIQAVVVPSTGERQLYRITRKGKSKRLNRAFLSRDIKVINKLGPIQKAIYEEYKNISKFAPTIYEVQRISHVEENEYYATTTEMPSTNTNAEINKLDEIDKIALRVYNDVKRKARKNPKFKKVVEIFQRHGINGTNSNDITNNKNLIFSRAAGLYKDLSNYINSQIENFDDTGMSIDDEVLYERAAEDREFLYELVNFLLEARTIGKSFDPIFQYDVTSLNAADAKNIEDIKKAINSIRNNIKIVKAMKNVFDITFAQFSRNPLIQEGLITLRTQFSDTDWFDYVFSDIHELNNSQIQVVLRFIEAQVEKARIRDIPQETKRLKAKIQDIIKKDLNFNWNNVRRNGKFVTPYNEDFIRDRDNFNKLVEDTRQQYGEYSVEFLKAKLERDKWYNDNTEQRVIKDYYNRKNAYTTVILRIAPEEFARYRYIMHELYGSGNFNNGELSDEQLRRRKELTDELRYLRSDVQTNGELKAIPDLHKTSALNSYIESMHSLNDEYFEKDVIESFQENLEYYLDVIKKYELNHPYEILSERLKDEKYLDAYNWLKANTIYTVSSELKAEINNAFKTIGANYEAKQFFKDYISEHPEVIDANGNVDGTKFPKEIVDNLRIAFQNRYNLDSDNPHITATRKELPAGRKQANASFWASIGARRSTAYDEILDAYNKEINQILDNAIDEEGRINSKKLFELDKNQIYRLIELYNLVDARKELLKDSKDNNWRKEFRTSVNFKTNDEAFEREYNWALTNLSGEDLVNWARIFAKWKDGTVVTNSDGNFVAGDNIYGYFEPKKEEHTNVGRAEALKFIQDNIEFVPTEYYIKAMNEARREGRWTEWFNENHIYNPYTEKYEPLNIWTQLKVKDSPSGDSRYEYRPIGDNVTSVVKPEFKNSKFNEFGYNYNGSSKYKTDVKQSPAEREMVEYLQGLMKQYSINDKMLSFVGKDFIPRLRLNKFTTKEAVKQGLGVAGLTPVKRSMRWKDDVGYEYDTPADFDMFAELKGKGTKQLIKIRPQLSDESEADYQSYVEDINKKNEDIKKENHRIDLELADDNMENIMTTFISRAIEYNAKEKIKPILYALLQDLKDNQAYSESSFSHKLKVDKLNSTSDHVEYRTEEQRRNIELLETYINRFIYGEFKQSHKLVKIADIMQNMTSAKYMIFNHTGGVANVLTGWTNIFGESFAREYFNNTDWAKAHKDYLGSVHYILAGIYTDEHKNLIDGILKQLDVVNLDNVVERRSGEDWNKYVERARNMLYSMQSSGEHYMQNTALLAMMYSHKLYQNDKGNWVVGSFAHYAWHKEKEVLRKLVAENPTLLRDYNQYAESVDNDVKTIKDFAQFTKDFNVEFLNTFGDKEFIKKYIAARDATLKEAKKEFDTFENIKDQFIYDKGVAVIKPDSKLTDEELVNFKLATISVNKKIHGVYDKIGAANIEKNWWGSVVMQYHKHMYPGIMKRWRRRGYYNEFRGSIEKGSYWSLIDFLSTNFEGAIKNAREQGGDDTQAVILQSIQNIVKATLNTITNFRLNYNKLPEWERANMRRILGDLIGITGGMLGLIVLGILGDDDDDIVDETWYNFLLYTSDRWILESQAFTPWGIVAEGKTLWSSPVAAFKGPEDLLKLTNLMLQSMFDEDFNPNYSTGKYKGQSKFKRLIIGNVPLMRNINRLEELNKNNQYYRLDNNSFRNSIIDEIVDYLD